MLSTYTNAATIVRDRFEDTEDLAGLFSGYEGDGKDGRYDRENGDWGYAGTPADPTLQHPLCVFQILKRHFARYTPDVVPRCCGCSTEQFNRVAELLCANSGRERTGASSTRSVGRSTRPGCR